MADPKAFLYVVSEPGPAVSEVEFHDWYDNEHVPLRVNTPTFSSWARWEQVDGLKPTWGATYDLQSYEATLVPPYSQLAETRSDREKDILSRLETLDRRTYEAYTGNPIHPPSALYDPSKTAPFVAIVSIEVKPEGEEEFNRWYDEEHIPLLAKTKGWIRSRRFVLKDSGSLGTDAAKKSAHKHMAVHEWVSFEGLPETEEYKAAMSTPWRAKVIGNFVIGYERRAFKLYKRWDREN